MNEEETALFEYVEELINILKGESKNKFITGQPHIDIQENRWGEQIPITKHITLANYIKGQELFNCISYKNHKPNNGKLIFPNSKTKLEDLARILISIVERNSDIKISGILEHSIFPTFEEQKKILHAVIEVINKSIQDKIQFNKRIITDIKSYTGNYEISQVKSNEEEMPMIHLLDDGFQITQGTILSKRERGVLGYLSTSMKEQGSDRNDRDDIIDDLQFKTIENLVNDLESNYNDFLNSIKLKSKNKESVYERRGDTLNKRKPHTIPFTRTRFSQSFRESSSDINEESLLSDITEEEKSMPVTRGIPTPVTRGSDSRPLEETKYELKYIKEKARVASLVGDGTNYNTIIKLEKLLINNEEIEEKYTVRKLLYLVKSYNIEEEKDKGKLEKWIDEGLEKGKSR